MALIFGDKENNFSLKPGDDVVFKFTKTKEAKGEVVEVRGNKVLVEVEFSLTTSKILVNKNSLISAKQSRINQCLTQPK